MLCYYEKNLSVCKVIKWGCISNYSHNFPKSRDLGSRLESLSLKD